MAPQQNLFGHEAQFETGEDAKVKQTRKPISGTGASSSNGNSCFDCNICFDSARDPVVTLCGHLYCWPCIYKWLHVRRTSVDAEEQQPTCPVCKANVSLNLLVPLYGRGSSSSETGTERATVDVAVPRRPPPSELRTTITNTPDQPQQLHPSILHPHSATAFHHQHYFANPYRGYTAMATSNLGGAALMSFFHPTVGMFGELMFARIFQTTDTNLFTNPPAGNIIPRMRRQEMQLDKSLNRVTVFLLCCILLCLLLF